MVVPSSRNLSIFEINDLNFPKFKYAFNRILKNKSRDGYSNFNFQLSLRDIRLASFIREK